MESTTYDLAHEREFFESEESIAKYQMDANFLKTKVGAHC